MNNNNDNQGVKDRIKTRLLEATGGDDLRRIRQELKDQGEKPGSVDACVSELRKQGHLKFNGKTTAITKSMPVEAIIENLPWPVDVDGHTNPVFIAGMKYEALNIVRGIRLAQEISALAISQAQPLIKMAQEMRPDASQIAKDTGLAMGEAMAGKVFDLVNEKPSRKADIATVPDPIMGLFARTMETVLSQFTGRMFAGQGGQQLGPTPGFTDKRVKEG